MEDIKYYYFYNSYTKDKFTIFAPNEVIAREELKLFTKLDSQCKLVKSFKDLN